MQISELELDIEKSDVSFDPAFRADVLNGLSQTQKTIPARWFYDLEGSRLFEAITRLAEYYPSRVERGLLHRHVAQIADRLGSEPFIVEFGSGSSVKTRILLETMPRATYVPIEICGAFLAESCRALSRDFPEVEILPVEADFMDPVSLPSPSPSAFGPVLGFFPGSTIGNLQPRMAVDLLRSMRTTLGEGSCLLIGIDRVKDRQRLLRAYDDAAGVTARFNLNLLQRLNRELEGTIPVSAFRHRASWNDDWSRVEMHLEATCDLAFEVAGQGFALGCGETIHTENCHKYTPGQMRTLLQAGGWCEQQHWVDENGDFSLILAFSVPDAAGP